MTGAQFAAYISAREREKTEGAESAMRGGGAVGNGVASKKVFFARQLHAPRAAQALQKPKSEFSSTYRVHSRQVGNYCAPMAVRDKMEARHGEELLPVGDILDGIGKIESAKYAAILERITQHHAGQLGLIYSQFVGLGGLASFARFLDQNGYEGKHATVSGVIPVEDRASIIDKFSARDNAHGEQLMLLLVSSTGAEGIDLKNVRHVHILEPYWNYGRIKQVRARAIRNQSHVDLPPEERNVATYVYMAVAPLDFKPAKPDGGDAPLSMTSATMLEKTSDEELYDSARRGQLMIEEFERAIREVSIECAINHDRAGRARECRICAPSGDKLFTDDIEGDMRVTDPCKPASSRTVAGVQKIKVGEITYTYRRAPPESIEGRVHGYEVFVEDTRINAWRKLRVNDARYDAIVAAIKSE
jgi:hypothetical protein